MQLDHMSLEELKRLRKDVEDAIKSFEDRRFHEAREKVEAQAREMGFTLSQLVQPSGKRKAVNPPKYRHPENPQLTWTGKGRKPSWITQALENGESLDQYAVWLQAAASLQTHIKALETYCYLFHTWKNIFEKIVIFDIIRQ